MCIRDRYQRRVRGDSHRPMERVRLPPGQVARVREKQLARERVKIYSIIRRVKQFVFSPKGLGLIAVALIFLHTVLSAAGYSLVGIMTSLPFMVCCLILVLKAIVFMSLV
eukprot:TRINITY_DN25751_c0_g1_i1.p1 TRINITY_DN25751_c0_g1~~TRINITY_DN25751_c0_g1_i1.p1  ORF type:complete len:110 (+),score=26.26 TRINITY_DN25751_c0_g1_i1:141-470(+)